MNFSDLPIISPLLKWLDKAWFTIPTPIQEKVIPEAILWKDILWIAQTWSWKTLAFALPILQNIYKKRLETQNPEWKIVRKIQALILAPTRELAIQIWETFAPYATNVNLKYTTIYGWVNQFHQVKALEKWVDILIATPWRLEDLISQWFIKLSYVDIFVLDEADKMLDMWFIPDIKKVVKRIPENRQTLFFSATMPTSIKELSNNLLDDPLEIKVTAPASTTDNITQKVYFLSTTQKRKLLQQIVKRKDLSSIIVFVKTKDDTEYVMDYINSVWIKCDNIHRNRSQNARQRAIKSLKDWEIKVLIATDIAARWIDINDLSCVVNFNIPKDPEAYVHRIWRTARAGKQWLAISMCNEEEKISFENIQKLIKKEITVVQDDSYKNEEISKTEYLWSFWLPSDKPKKRWPTKSKRFYGKSEWQKKWTTKLWSQKTTSRQNKKAKTR